MEEADLIKIAFNYGVPTGILVILFVGLYFLGKSFKRDVVVPLVKSHLLLIRSLQKSLPEQSKELKAQTALLQTLKKDQNRATEKVCAAIHDANKIRVTAIRSLEAQGPSPSPAK